MRLMPGWFHLPGCETEELQVTASIAAVRLLPPNNSLTSAPLEPSSEAVPSTPAAIVGIIFASVLPPTLMMAPFLSFV